MENLNAEQVKNEIQSLIKALKDCGGWVKRGNGEGWFNHEILADALALIHQLTEDNTKLANLIPEKDVIIFELSKQVERLTEENERVRAEAENQSVLWKQHFESIYATAKETVKADTVRKMQEMVNECFDSESDEPKQTHDYIRYVIEQIAKELLEGVCDT